MTNKFKDVDFTKYTFCIRCVSYFAFLENLDSYILIRELMISQLYFTESALTESFPWIKTVVPKT